jgi:tetratricopeptide (TPR) repeat protein
VIRLAAAALLAACAALGPPAYAAAEAGAAAAFEAGVTAFRAGDYRVARDRFKAARRRGLDTPNLDLNLGLAHYRLGELDEARECFERVRSDLQYTALADYHLGLIAAERGDRDTALWRLQGVQAIAPSRVLRDQASVALRRLDDTPLEEEPATPEVEQPDGVYFLRAATGFDSNPELVSESLDRPAAGDGAAYADVRGNLEHPLGATALGTTLFRANLHLRQHDSEAGFDHQSGELGLRQAWQNGRWRYGAGAEGGAAWLDGEAYQSNGAVLFDARRRRHDTTLALRYEGMRVAGEGEYVYLDGWRHRLDADLARSFGSLRARGDVEYELNERRDLAVGEEFSSYSPSRIGIGTSVTTPALRQVALEVRARYRDSSYRDANRFLDDGALREERRHDRLAIAGLRFRLRSGQTWNWLLDYQFSRNDSNLDAFGYTRHVAAVGVEWLK